MNKNSNQFCNCRRRALTLIEVIAGLALMATLLTGVLTAGSQHMRQLHRAKQRLAAAALADQLLTTWARSEQDLPLGGNDAPDASGLIWRVRSLGRPNVPDSFGLEIVRFEVFDANVPQPSLSSEKPLVFVDIVNQSLPDNENSGG